MHRRSVIRYLLARQMDANGLTLVIPEKPDEERNAVAAAWERVGGDVLRLGRFWDPPPLDPANTRVYANDTFALVLREKIGLNLISPADDLLLSVPPTYTRRRLNLVTLAGSKSRVFPTFAKSLIPKLISSRVYGDHEALLAESEGLPYDTQLLLSEVIPIDAEIRCFALNGRVLDCAAYEGQADLAVAAEFAEQVLKRIYTPYAVVLDLAISAERPLVLEFNPAWGAGLNGCNAEAVLPAIANASAPVQAG